MISSSDYQRDEWVSDSKSSTACCGKSFTHAATSVPVRKAPLPLLWYFRMIAQGIDSWGVAEIVKIHPNSKYCKVCQQYGQKANKIHISGRTKTVPAISLTRHFPDVCVIWGTFMLLDSLRSVTAPMQISIFRLMDDESKGHIDAIRRLRSFDIFPMQENPVTREYCEDQLKVSNTKYIDEILSSSAFTEMDKALCFATSIRLPYLMSNPNFENRSFATSPSHGTFHLL